MNDILNRLKENQHWLLRDGFKTSANNVRDAFNEIITLREQVEKLTKERDTEIARNRPLQSLIKSQEEIKSFLLKKSEENKEAVKQLDSERQANAMLTEEVAALAAQNEKMRDSWLRISLYETDGTLWNLDIRSLVHEALAIPDLTTPALNK